MIKLNKKEDLKIIANKLNLSLDKTSLLFSEEKDKILVLEQIIHKISNEDLKKMSFPLNFSLFFFKENNKKLNQKQLDFIEEILNSKLLYYTSGALDLKLKINYNNNLEAAKNNLILYSLFEKECTTPHLLTIENGFKNSPIEKNLNEVISILKKSKFLLEKMLTQTKK